MAVYLLLYLFGVLMAHQQRWRNISAAQRASNIGGGMAAWHHRKSEIMCWQHHGGKPA